MAETPTVTVTSTVGRLTEFDPRNDSITAYVERVTYISREVADAKKVAVLLSAIGPKTYALLRNLTTSTAPAEKSFAQIVEILKGHYEPKPLIIAERFNFHRRSQHVRESVKEFAAELQHLTIHCEFGTHLDEALRDRFVRGLGNETMQKRLLTEKDLTFKGAIDITYGMESAAKHTQSLQGGVSHTHSDATHRVGQGVAKECYRCDQSSHRQTQCPYRNVKCHNWDTLGKCTGRGKLTTQPIIQKKSRGNQPTLLLSLLTMLTVLQPVCSG